MKPRRVMVTLEMTTDIALKVLRDPSAWAASLGWDYDEGVKIHHVQVNVIATPKKEPPCRRR